MAYMAARSLRVRLKPKGKAAPMAKDISNYLGKGVPSFCSTAGGVGILKGGGLGHHRPRGRGDLKPSAGAAAPAPFSGKAKLPSNWPGPVSRL
jgi:hypothetical protein